MSLEYLFHTITDWRSFQGNKIDYGSPSALTKLFGMLSSGSLRLETPPGNASGIIGGDFAYQDPQCALRRG